MLCIVNTFLFDLPKNPRNQYRALPIGTGRQPLRKNPRRETLRRFPLFLQAVAEPSQRQMRHPPGCLRSGACALRTIHGTDGAVPSILYEHGRLQPGHRATAPRGRQPLRKNPRRETLRRFPLFPSGHARASPKTNAPSSRMPRVRRLRTPDHPRNRRSGSLHSFKGARACGRVTRSERRFEVLLFTA